MKASKFLSLNTKDLAKGAIVAFASAVLTAVYNSLQTGVFPTTWDQYKPILLVGAAALIAYLSKNLLTGEQGKFLSK